MNRIRMAGLLGGLCLGSLFCSKAHAETLDRGFADLASDTAEASIALHGAWMKSGTVVGYRPSGWLWFSWPYAYDNDAGDWYWLHSANAQLVVGPWPTGNWIRLGNSALANGWTYFNWPYAYDWEGQGWYYMNSGDTQWCVNLRTGQWALFGRLSSAPPVIPAGMVLISGGTNAGTDPDLGAYSLTVSAFYIDRYEVTKALWDEVYNWAIANGYSFDNSGSGKAANHPVHTVNWYDAVKWCNARSQKEGRPAVYTVNGVVYKTGRADNVFQSSAAGYRLPTDLEWHYAARGGVANRRFPWEDSDTIQHARANYNSYCLYSFDTSPTRGYHPTYATGGFPYTSPVGSFSPNGYGLYDMAGNVWEWCIEWYPGLEGSSRVIRSGSWGFYSINCRVTDRYHGYPDDANHTRGFRVVLPAQ